MLWVLALAVSMGLTLTVISAQEDQPTAPELTPSAPDEEPGKASPPAAGEGKEAPPEKPSKDQQRSKGPFDARFLFIMIGIFALMYFWMGRGRKKQETKRKEMLAMLKKGDKITSIGGIVGTVIEVREDELVVKVDENNNVRVRLARWAVRGVGEQAKSEGPDQKK